jgi:hypothetical protein
MPSPPFTRPTWSLKLRWDRLPGRPSGGASKQRRGDTLLPQGPGEKPLPLVWDPLAEMWWGERGRSVAVVMPAGWELEWGALFLVLALVGLLPVVWHLNPPEASAVAAVATRRGGHEIDANVAVGCLSVAALLVAARLLGARIVQATPRWVRVTLRLGPLEWRREVPLQAVEGAFLREGSVGKGGSSRRRMHKRYSAALGVRNGFSITLFPSLIPARREPLDRVVSRIGSLLDRAQERASRERSASRKNGIEPAPPIRETSPMTSRRASCSCGQLSVTCEGEPLRVSICHCHACQQRTGSPFGQQARWPAEKVTVAGEATTYVRTGDAGGAITFRFCPKCGATVFFEVDKMPGSIAVPVGAFADATFPAPTFSMYESRKHPWVAVPDDFQHLD